jgi:putative Ca2+/H+ antiporter (TMEM165/GDT1 family)
VIALFSSFLVVALAEMGDKTQLATVALAARFGAPFTVITGTTLGMLAADGLAVFAGKYLAAFVPMTWIRRVAAALFFLFGILAVAATRHQMGGPS